MKFAIILFAALFAVALAAPVDNDKTEIISRESDVQPESFKYSQETSDGNKQFAEGELHDIGSEHEELVVRGSYSFIGDDGVTYTVNYIADKNGFQPQGAHIPVA